MNTLISITASVLSSSFISLLYDNKFDMMVVLNATLAGGVAIGTACEFLTQPYLPFVIGLFAGVISAIGFKSMNKLVQSEYKLHDTRGI